MARFISVVNCCLGPRLALRFVFGVCLGLVLVLSCPGVVLLFRLESVRVRITVSVRVGVGVRARARVKVRVKAIKYR